jgi:hypothetical protein
MELATLLGQDQDQLDLNQIEPQLAQLKADLAALTQRQTDRRDAVIGVAALSAAFSIVTHWIP